MRTRGTMARTPGAGMAGAVPGLGSVASMALLAVLTACSRAPEQRPNVLLVTLDTTRPDYMSTYGYREGHTPNFDALADEGVRFDMALSCSAVTPVSHATILTGLYPYRHGVRVLSAPDGFRVPADVPTLATRLREAGYATVAALSAFPVSEYFGFERDFDHFDSLGGSMKTERSWNLRELQRRSDDTTDRALALATASAEPFFLWVHYWDPHDPHLVPPDEFTVGVERKWPSDEWYAVEVRYVDAQFGRLVRGLEERGLWEDTIAVLTADHGEGLSDGERIHGWHGHRMLYQEQIRVPLIVRLPGGPAGLAVGELARTVDVLPTVLDYAGIPFEEGLDGRSLRDLIEGSGGAPRVAYADQINGYDLNATMVKKHPEAAFLYGLVDGEWKLVYRPHMPERSELFHLASDPREETNLFEERPEVAQRLLAELAARRPWVLAPFADSGLQEPGAASALTALGYAAGDGELGESEWAWTCPLHPSVRQDEPTGHADCDAAMLLVAAE